MKCAICRGEIEIRCRCIRGDSTCVNGHSYHWSHADKEFHEGWSDHSKRDPHCCEEKKKISV